MARCQQMVQYENKCQWTECQVPSTSPPTSTPSTTAAPPPTTPEPEPSCLALEAQIEDCVQQGNTTRDSDRDHNDTPCTGAVQSMVRQQRQELGEKVYVDRLCWMSFV